METAFKEYKRKSFILKDKIAAKLIEVCQSLEVDSQEYRSKISALLKEIKEKLKIIHDTFDKELHEVREPVKSNPSGKEIQNRHQADSSILDHSLCL